MRRLTSIILGLAIALGAAASLAAAVVSAGPEAKPGPTPKPRVSPCIGDATARAMPRALLLGETTAVTLHFRATCPPEYIRFHVVFVVDPSARMGGSGP